MPLDPRVRRFLDLLAASNPASALSLSVQARRDGLAHLMSFAGPPPSVGAVEDRTLEGPGGALRIRIYRPPRNAGGTDAALVYFHGGGLVAGSIDTHDVIARGLARAGDCAVVAVDYRLGPEHRFPAALDDALAALRYVKHHAAELGFAPARIGVAGDSAGGALAAAAAASEALAVQVLLCPIVDYAGSTPSRLEFGAGYLVDAATLEHDLRHYLAAGTDPSDPRVSPLRARHFHALPPTLVHTAECDPLRDEGRAYADRLTEAGVRVRYTCHPGMIHLFYGLGAVIPYARTFYEQLSAELRALLA